MDARSWPRLAAALIGLCYFALGLAGFFTPGTAAPGHDTSHTVWLFSSSVVLNLVHTLVGVLGLALSLRRVGGVAFGWVLFFGFSGLTAYGVLAAAFSHPLHDPVNINWADDWLHGLTALAGLLIALLGSRVLGRRSQV